MEDSGSPTKPFFLRTFGSKVSNFELFVPEIAEIRFKTLKKKKIK